MNVRPTSLASCLIVSAVALSTAWLAYAVDEWKSGKQWPEPKLIDPGDATKAPSDAIVLFDGKDMSAWKGGDKWEIKDGVATVKGGGAETKQPFGDIQMHIEWASPAKVESGGQGRGNSGVYLMGQYEVQILDSWSNPTYVDGQAASIYKQSPPLVNASRKPGEWQAYDIIFHRPHFNNDGSVKKPATVTVLHNGVLVQDHWVIEGKTAYDAAPKYSKHGDKAPIQLQDHGNPVRFRNIWVRELKERPEPEIVQPEKK